MNKKRRTYADKRLDLLAGELGTGSLSSAVEIGLCGVELCVCDVGRGHG